MRGVVVGAVDLEISVRIALGILLLLVAVIIAWVALRQPAGRARRGSQAVSGGSFLVGFALLTNLIGRLTILSPTTNVEHNEGVVGPVENVIIGSDDKHRFDQVVAAVADEYLTAVGNRIAEVNAVEAMVPEPFWDGQRSTETGADYQDRARQSFVSYVDAVESSTRIAPLIDGIYRGSLPTLAHDGEVLATFRSAYEHLETSHNAFVDQAGLVPGLRAQASRTGLSDERRHVEAERLWRRATIDARVSVLQSMAAAITIPQLEGHPTFVVHAQALMVPIDRDEPSGWRAAFLNEAARLMSDKAAIFAEALDVGDEEEASAPGAGTAEGAAAQELVTDAAVEFLAGNDDRAAAHLRDAIASDEFDEPLLSYVQASLDRIQDPERFGSGLGLFVLRIDPGSRFDRAGVEMNDIITMVGKAPVNDVPQLTSALVSANDVEIEIRRSTGEIETVTVGGTGAGGAVVSPLVLLHAQQI